MTVPRDTCAPSPGIPEDLAGAGNRWLIICCPHHRIRVCDPVPVHTGVCCEHVRAVQRLQRPQWQEMRHSSQCFVFFLIKTFPFSCTFASCEQGPEVPFCGKSGSGDSGGRGCIYFQMQQGWSALISSHALAGMRGHCGEDAASAGSKDRGMFNIPGRVNESIFVQM